MTLRRPHLPVGAIVASRADSVALTFDDGPDERFTPDLLRVLSAHGTSATFFVLLTKVRRNPALLDDLVRAGHEVGLHGPDHRRITGFGMRAATERLAAARGDLEELTRRPVRWYRPPYGEQSATSYLAARRAGLESVLWSATTWDWKDVSQQQRTAKALEGCRPGAILLAHDGAIDERDGAPGEPVVECDRPALVDDLLSRLHRRGIRTGPLGEAVDSGADRSLRFVIPRSARPRTSAA